MPRRWPRAPRSGRRSINARRPSTRRSVARAKWRSSRPSREADMAVRIQEADFDTGAELDRITKGNKKIGGLAVFVGLVREMHVREGLHRDRIDALTLEHYPGMTETALADIEAEAKRRWPLEATLIVHRYGRLEAGERIVLVVVGSAHREAAFEACEFLVDWLKTKAPFWKLEETPAGEKWVGAHDGDDAAAARWEKNRP